MNHVMSEHFKTMYWFRMEGLRKAQNTSVRILNAGQVGHLPNSHQMSETEAFSYYFSPVFQFNRLLLDNGQPLGITPTWTLVSIHTAR